MSPPLGNTNESGTIGATSSGAEVLYSRQTLVYGRNATGKDTSCIGTVLAYIRVGSQCVEWHTGGKKGVVVEEFIGYDSTGLPFSFGVPSGFTGPTADDI